MYGVLSSHTYIEDIIKGVGRSPLFHKVGTFEEDTFISHIQASTRLTLSMLIIDITCCSPDVLFKGIRLFRVQKSAVRIVIVAPGKKPGDVTISRLVSLGIYDIVAPSIPESIDNDEDIHYDISPFVKQRIEQPGTYADVVRWDYHVFEHGQEVNSEPANRVSAGDKNTNEKVVVQEKVIIREKIVGSIVIGVIGAGRGSGTTHSAIQIATFLAQNKKSIACIEYVDSDVVQPVFHTFETDHPSKLYPGGFYSNQIDFFSYSNVENIYDVLAAKYDYIVLDLGCFTVNDRNTKASNTMDEFLRSNIQIITTGVSEWDLQDFFQCLKEIKEQNWKRKWNILVNYSDDELFRVVSKDLFTSRDQEELQIKFFQNPFQPNPYKIGDLTIEVLQKLLQSVLPGEKEKKKGLLSLLGIR